MTPEIAQSFASAVAWIGAGVALVGAVQFGAWLWGRQSRRPARRPATLLCDDVAPFWWTIDDVILEAARRRAAITELVGQLGARYSTLRAEMKSQIAREAEAWDD